MDLVKIEYSGRKGYKDKASGTTWAPGDIKPVTVLTAKRLLKFAEFNYPKNEADQAKEQEGEKAEEVKGKAELTPEEQAAIAKQNEADQAKEAERQQLEAMLLTIGTMDKNALAEYAEKYEVTLDKRGKVGDLRQQVEGLVEQFGVR